jgi:hypothetical protein
MRLSSCLLLGVCLLLFSTLVVGPVSTAGQSSQIDNATSKLNAAFMDVRTANSDGVSAAKVSELTNELNTALSYDETAVILYDAGNFTGSGYYASLSGNLSSTVSAEAKGLEVDAKNQMFFWWLFANLVAQLAAVLSALVLIEFHHMESFVRRRRLQRTRPE